MPVNTPQEVHEHFARYFSSGDLDGLVSLYESTAVMCPQPGVKVAGVAAIREVLAGFLALKGEFQLTPGPVIQGEDIAILFSEWSLAATAPDSSPIALSGQTSDVVRRQPDGSWLFVIDNPFGPNVAS